MTKTLFLTLLLSLVLTACITVSSQPATSSAPVFVTSTLPPAKSVPPRPTLTSAPEQAVTGTLASVTSLAQCQHTAILLADVTYPDNSSVPAGQAFTKTWRLKNTGACPWTGFTVSFASGERMSAPASVAVPQTAPGGTVDVSVDLAAPGVDGTHTAYFTLQSPSGERVAIGTQQTFYVQVIVGTACAPVVVTSPSIPIGTPALSIGAVTIYCRYSYSENAAYVQDLTSLINQARLNAGLSALGLSPLLAQAAQGHSVDMACNNFLSHQGSDGSPFGALVRAVGYPTSFQEILAIGTSQNAMDQWRADPGHWEIVLNPLATEMGVGYAYNPASDYGGYFTVDLH